MCHQVGTVAEAAIHGMEGVDVATEVDVVVVIMQHPSSQAHVGIATRWGIVKQNVERSSKMEEDQQQEEGVQHTSLKSLK